MARSYRPHHFIYTNEIIYNSMDSAHIKDFYSTYSDRITQNRYHSPYLLRHYAHEQQYQSVLRFVEPGMRVLDAGCGEGVLAFLMAQKGAHVVGCDISEPNIVECQRLALEQGLHTIEFRVADSEHLPFEDDSFDLVVSSHVLEHLPDFDQGLREAMRVTSKHAVLAIPTIYNFCSIVQVGHGWFFLKGVRSFAGFFIGLGRLARALLTPGSEGVDEGYAGHESVPHVFRFPSVMLRKCARHNLRVVHYEASSICLPYFSSLLPVIRYLDRYRAARVMRNFGYGTTYVVEK